MAKRSKDPLEQARRKLAKAQLDLHFAQEQRLAAMAQGERELQEAQKRSDRRTKKATERLEKRAGAVARAEAQLITLTDRLARIRAESATAVRATDSFAVPEHNGHELSRRDGV
jgi:hypothetical protein